MPPNEAIASLSPTGITLAEKIRAGYPAIFLLSSEEGRARAELAEVSKAIERPLHVWTYGKGLKQENPPLPRPTRGAATPGHVTDTENALSVLNHLTTLEATMPAIILLRLFHEHLDDALIKVSVLDLLPKFKLNRKTLIILSPVMKLPPEIEKEFALVEMDYPDKEVLKGVLNGIIKGSPKAIAPSEEARLQIVESAMGMTTNGAENAFSLSLIRSKAKSRKNAKGEEDLWDPEVVLREKCEELKKTGLLEYTPLNGVTEADLGGMENYKVWLRRRIRAFTQDARDFGVPSPKGVLMVGPPGSGKSLGARVTSAVLHLPLLRFDIGRLFGSLVGQSESNTRMALKVAEAMSPCILWIDEIEKAFEGSQGGNDSGVGARVLGSILTWMQEKTHPIFVYATANNVSRLPPELLRKGRFDEMFSVNLPSEEERKEIFRIHIRKCKREALIADPAKPNASRLDLNMLAKNTEGFSGAEIEAAVLSALTAAYADGKDLNSMDLVREIDETLPVSVSAREIIQQTMAWCEKRTRSANKVEKKATAETGSTRNVEIQ